MKGRLIALAILLLAFALIAAATPQAPSAYAAPVPREERGRNAELLTALAAAGIERAWPDASTSTILVVYELPANTTLSVAQAYVLGAEAVAAPDAAILVARTTAGAEWSVARADVAGYQNGSLSLGDIEARIVRS